VAQGINSIGEKIYAPARLRAFHRAKEKRLRRLYSLFPIFSSFIQRRIDVGPI
jgi:hypothetical protein